MKRDHRREVLTLLTCLSFLAAGAGAADPPKPVPVAAPAGEAAKPTVDEITITLPGDVPLTLVRVRAGTFTMGSPAGERGRAADEAQHQVKLSHDFYLGKYEVTQAQWQAVTGQNPSSFKTCGGTCPVERVTWESVAAPGGFLEKLNQLQSSTKFRLPTEAEWEYAARAGAATRYSYGDVLECNDLCSRCPAHEQYMWWCGDAGEGPHPVGEKAPNAFGLFDMHGNVWEWVSDWYSDQPLPPATDPTGPATGLSHVIKGGAWYLYATYCRSADRHASSLDRGYLSVGFRLARSE